MQFHVTAAKLHYLKYAEISSTKSVEVYAQKFNTNAVYANIHLNINFRHFRAFFSRHNVKNIELTLLTNIKRNTNSYFVKT